MYIKPALIVSLLFLFIIPFHCTAQTEQEFNFVSAKLNGIHSEGIQLSQLSNGDDEILIEGDAINPKQLADYIKAINATETGKLIIREIYPTDENGRRKFHFKLSIKSAVADLSSTKIDALPAFSLQKLPPEDSIMLPKRTIQHASVDSLSPIYSIESLMLKAKSIEVKESSFMHSTLAEFSNGDFVNVSLSPSGKKLAYAKSILQKDKEIQEITELSIYDLLSKKSQELLSAEDSKRYAVYKAFVYAMGWKKQNELVASISDGDVDSTVITFSTDNGKIISTEYVEAGLEPEAIDKGNSLAKALLEIFPDWDVDVLKNYTRSALFINNRALISQRNFSKYNNNVILLDLEQKKAIPLIQMSDGMQYAMAGGGVLPDGRAMFSLRSKEGMGVFILDSDNSLLPLGFIRSSNKNFTPQIVVKHVSDSGVYFIAMLNQTYERGNNPMYFYSSKLGLVRCSDFLEIYDADFSKDGGTIAAIYWNSNQRNIRIAQQRELAAE